MPCGRKIGPYDCCSVVCGDCLELLKALPDGCVEIAVTSPPYNLVNKWSATLGPRSIFQNWQARKEASWYADDLPEEEYQRAQTIVLQETMRVCHSSVFYNHKLRYAWKRVGRIIHPLEWLGALPIWAEIIWDRGSGMTFNSRRLVNIDERIYWLKKPRKWNALNYQSIWRINQDTEAPDHPCAFPTEIPKRCIELVTDLGDVILDPYLGSGTTAVAALKFGRHFLGFEISEEYCRIARERIALVEAQPNLFEKKMEQGKLSL